MSVTPETVDLPPHDEERRPAPPERETSRGRRVAVETVVLIATALVVAVVLRTFVAQAFYIPSESMVPQLAVGDRVIVSKLAYDLHDPRRGDVVVFTSPYPQAPDDAALPERLGRAILESMGLRQPSTEDFIKRVIALPGESVEGRDGGIFVDGRQLIEPYLPPGSRTSDFGPVVVGPDELWVMGDNRSNSSDSRVFGPIVSETVLGRAFVTVWPPGQASFL